MPHTAVNRSCVTQTRFYENGKRLQTGASEVNSPRDKFFNASFNGPKLLSSEGYSTKISELTQDRI